ncbi:MAG: outer membrane beta-barrel protein, partial [Bacteroidia bacterium]|nr:outer membrane beta-barrel protein [Bacteroidia bacterium]
MLKVFIDRPREGLVLRLTPLESETEPVQIVAEVDKETEAGVFVERLRQLEIGELYSQEQIAKRSTDFYVPNVLRRLPGVSLLSGRFISLRGLAERYNAFAFGDCYPAWLTYDGSFLEVEQLLSNLLGKIEVRKFWTPELLGHFGGGLVDMHFPTGGGKGLQVSFTSEIDFQTIGRPFPYFRRLRKPIPANFPSPAAIRTSENNGRPLAENFTYGRGFRRYTVPDTLGWVPPGGFLTLSYATQGEKWRLSAQAAITQRFLWSGIRFSPGEFVEQNGEIHYVPVTISEGYTPLLSNIRGGGLSWHLTYQAHPFYSFTLEGIGFTTTSQHISLERTKYINPNVSLEPRLIYYPTFLLQRQYCIALRPAWHFAFSEGWRGAWQWGFLSQGQDIPQTGAMNYIQYPGDSTFTYERELWGDYEIYAQVWTSRARSSQLYTHPWVEKQWKVPWGWLQWRMGGYFSIEGQTLRGRQLGFMPDTAGGAPNVLEPQVYALEGISSVYAPEHIRPGGWYLIERTGDFHRHRGRTTIAAGYTWLRSALGQRWEALLGLRYELWQRRLWHTPIATEIETPLKTFQDQHFLPALLLKYQLSERHALRGGANMTLIRPPLPSQVPLPYFRFFTGYYWQGDTVLSTSRSYNAELRYEWLRDKDNLLAIGLFYKYLRDLPEIYLVPASYVAVLAYSNRQRRWGEIWGLEIELRRIWWESEKNRLWSYLTLTLSESALEQNFWRKLGRLEGRLQGHAPIVGNLGLIYQRPRWEAALFGNYTHDQIWALGFDPYVFPHIIEENRLVGEAQISYRIGKRWEVRLAILDFVNMSYRR